MCIYFSLNQFWGLLPCNYCTDRTLKAKVLKFDNVAHSYFLTDKMKRSFFQVAVVSILLYGCTSWTLTKRMEKKLDGTYIQQFWADTGCIPEDLPEAMDDMEGWWERVRDIRTDGATWWWWWWWCEPFKLYMELSNAQRISTPTNPRLLITSVIYHGFNCLFRELYTQQSSNYQNTAKFLKHPR